jgi:hypothetical protein
MNTSSTRPQVDQWTETCPVCGSTVDYWWCATLTYPKRAGRERYTYRVESAHRVLNARGQRLPCPGKPAV